MATEPRVEDPWWFDTDTEYVKGIVQIFWAKNVLFSTANLFFIKVKTPRNVDNILIGNNLQNK